MLIAPKVLSNHDAKFYLALMGSLVISLASPIAMSANATWQTGVGNWLENVLFWSGGFPAAGDDIFISDPNLEQRLVVAQAV